MAITELTDIDPQSATDIMGYPSVVFPNFWLMILAAIWAILTSGLYARQVERKGEGNILRSMSSAAMAIWIVTIVGFMSGLILLDTLQKVSAFSIILLGIWFFNK